MPTRRLSDRLLRAILVAAVVALALAQTLGALHAIVHAPRLASTGPVGVQERAVAPRSDWLGDLFAGHGHADHACELYDQLSHADLMPAVLPALPAVLPPVAADTVHVAWRLASQAAGFLARGPPSFFLS
jgi:hypothetical protein